MSRRSRFLAAVAARSAAGGFALVATLYLVAAIALLCTALFTMLRYEYATVAAHEREFRADLAAESGLQESVARIAGFLRREDVGGASFTTWSYTGRDAGSHLALTAGRPEKTTPAAPWLDANNTIWPGTTGDPDDLWAGFAAGDPSVIDLNADGKICADKRPMPALWRESGSAGGVIHRHAVWVDDESSRLDLGAIAAGKRIAGESPGEIPVFSSPNLAPPVAARTRWVTEQTARILLGSDAGLTNRDDFLTTTHNTNYRVIQWAPPGQTDKKPSRGRPRRNLNWQGWIDGSQPADDRVALLADWIRCGAPDFFRHGAPSFWPAGEGAVPPVFHPPLADVPPLRFVRENQIATIAASIIDYLDRDTLPTQPAWLAAAAVHLPAANTNGVEFLAQFDIPGYFGADRCPRVNEMQILWNCQGAADSYKARPSVQREMVGPGEWDYTIPVTFRFELWNMDKLPVPARTYALRTFFIQQILGTAFGSTGALPIPETSEPVFLLNNGNPLAFAPNEFKVFEITRTFVRRSNLDRGDTWKSFMAGGPDTWDDQPDGHQRQAHVLCDPDTGAWYHATCYKQMSETPVDGVCSAGIGSSGESQGNKINDPRMEPLRAYLLDSTTGADLDLFDGERDGAGNKPGKFGFPNNKAGSRSFNYQDFERWIDRPRFTDPLRPSEGVTRTGRLLPPPGGGPPVEIARFLSAGDLGRIFDPGWVHPGGRGGDDKSGFAYHAGCRSGFHGGGTLRIGQSDGMDRLAANSWNVLDLFDTDPGAWDQLDNEEFVSPITRGRINVNVPKHMGTNRSVLETVFALPELFDGAPGDAATGIDTGVLRRAIESRLALGGTGGIGGTITSWKQCRPFFSTGELSELPAWEDPALFHGKVAAVPGQPAGLNRGDAGREEVFARAASLLTTFSHCYRFTVIGSTGRRDASGAFQEASRRTRQYVVFFDCSFDSDTGKLTTIRPRTVRQIDL